MTTLSHQLVERTVLNHLAILNLNNAVAFLDCSKAVGDYDRSSAVHDLFESCLYFLLRIFIESACCFVKQQDLGITNHCASDRNSLLLATRKLRALSTTHNRVTIVKLSSTFLFVRSHVKDTLIGVEFALFVFLLLKFGQGLDFLVVFLFTEPFDEHLLEKIRFHRG